MSSGPGFARGPGPRRPAFDQPPARPSGPRFSGTRPTGERPAEGTALPAPDLIGEGEEIVAGRRPVEEAFVARRPSIRLLVVPQRRQALEKIVLHATNLRIPIVEVEGGTLTSLAGFDGHQGVALIVGPRRFATLDDVWARARERGEPPFVLVLDSLEDPQNVGTLLRSAEAVGVHGIVYPTHRQAPLSPSAVKASAGAVEHLLLVPVDDLPGTLAEFHVRGLRVAGSDGDAPLLARQADLRGPLALVVGSEGQGIGPAVRRRCDFLVRVPMRGRVGSLNAAVAGSVLLFEVLAQRDPDGTLAALPVRAASTIAVVEPSADVAAEVPAEVQPLARVEPEEPAASAALDPPDATRRRVTRKAARPAGPDPELLPGGPAVPAPTRRRSAANAATAPASGGSDKAGETGAAGPASDLTRGANEDGPR